MVKEKKQIRPCFHIHVNILATARLLCRLCCDVYSENLRELKPMTSQLTALHSSGKVRGAIVTVRGSLSAAGAANSNSYDFASRYFAPWVGINEDPVTGR